MAAKEQSHIRFLIVFMLFTASCFSYGDRVVLSIVGGDLSHKLGLTPLKLGYLFSGFSWAYVVAQLPAGGLLDRYGSKKVYGLSIVAWSILALIAGCIGFAPVAWGFALLFVVRLLSGLAQSPVFPGNGRIVAAWFPTAERGRASAIFNSSQYFALVLFGPVMGWLVHRYGWMACFWLGGVVSLMLSVVWFRVIYGVKSHPHISDAEISHIEQGGGLANMDQNLARGAHPNQLTWSAVRMLLSNRMLVGIYIGQYCITTLTWFFLTWFPVYLNQARHISIAKTGLLVAVPALCGSIGGVFGGIVSDKLLKSGKSLSVARKVPIVAGMALSMTMIGCNYVSTQTLVILLMSLAFFGKGFGALGWTVISDVSPRNMIGINGGLFNLIGNLAGITTPIIIGFIVQRTGSFNLALVFVGFTALAAIVAYLPLVGRIHRVEFATKEQVA
ncbi:MFS transporter [Terriglobus tenax]|uniref:MFS transporter n=1 Tax=Terriglobus tenax TaxID=1111115 RepID=UPI0021DF4970|nr:MFS transporter [Terriglobus tenax]